MDNKTAIIFIGIQACGKSTFYRERFSDIVHINLDTLRTRKKENKLLEECFLRKHFASSKPNPRVLPVITIVFIVASQAIVFYSL